MPILLVMLSLLAVGCGGSRGSAVAPDAGPAEAVTQFMRAVADSNLSAMAMLWGTSSGPAATTRVPPNYQQRMQITHAYLKGTEARAVTVLRESDDRVDLQVELMRQDCSRRVPFTVVRLRDGRWIVSNIDIAAVGPPGRPCQTEERRPPM